MWEEIGEDGDRHFHAIVMAKTPHRWKALRAYLDEHDGAKAGCSQSGAGSGKYAKSLRGCFWFVRLCCLKKLPALREVNIATIPYDAACRYCTVPSAKKPLCVLDANPLFSQGTRRRRESSFEKAGFRVRSSFGRPTLPRASGQEAEWRAAARGHPSMYESCKPPRTANATAAALALRPRKPARKESGENDGRDGGNDGGTGGGKEKPPKQPRLTKDVKAHMAVKALGMTSGPSGRFLGNFHRGG